ncbi:FAD-dependent monooxygenase [Streptomonospora alba]|uniref:FAD-dependent monooxygenase n=1 Tax=Streptomonospora alba TaxID=183763 RepID=UPI000A4BB43C|nr:FAD-dependent monooxygenase [Streptomonospora alba]
MVVGAGIAGMSLAAALTRDGVGVTVLEQAPGPAPAGAGIQLTPNALRPLLRLGLGPALERVGVRPAARDVLRWDDDRLLGSAPLGDAFAERYGASTLTLLCSDLHRVLSGAVPSDAVRYGRYVTDLLEDSDGVTVRCSDGRQVHGDVAVGADGANSLIRSLLNTERYRPPRRLLYRGLAPASRVPELCGRARIHVWAGHDRYILCFPVAAGRKVCFTAAVPAGADDPGYWTTRNRVVDLTAAFDGWSPAVPRLISAAEWVGVRGVHDHSPVPVWHRGRVALMGDAAHPTLPFFAQEPNQAVEDAVALAGRLREATALSVDGALEDYARTRKARTDRLHAVTRQILATLRASGERTPEAWERAVAKAEEANAEVIYGREPAEDGARPVGADPTTG